MQTLPSLRRGSIHRSLVVAFLSRRRVQIVNCFRYDVSTDPYAKVMEIYNRCLQLDAFKTAYAANTAEQWSKTQGDCDAPTLSACSSMLPWSWGRCFHFRRYGTVFKSKNTWAASVHTKTQMLFWHFYIYCETFRPEWCLACRSRALTQCLKLMPKWGLKFAIYAFRLYQVCFQQYHSSCTGVVFSNCFLRWCFWNVRSTWNTSHMTCNCWVLRGWHISRQCKYYKQKSSHMLLDADDIVIYLCEVCNTKLVTKLVYKFSGLIPPVIRYKHSASQSTIIKAGPLQVTSALYQVVKPLTFQNCFTHTHIK